MTRFWLLLLLASALRAESPTPLDRGFLELYHLRFAEGRRLIQEWVIEHPDDPMGPAALAASHLFEEFEAHGVLSSEFFLDDDTFLGGIKGEPNESRMRRFRDANALARQLAENVLKKDPNNGEALLAITMGLGMQANAASLIEKRQLEALRLTREGDNWARRLLLAAPRLLDGYMALGATSYIIASLPFYKRALLRIGGIKGDKQDGMNSIAKTAQGGHYLRPYAKIMLALACLREKQAERARLLLGELVTEYPGSPLFRREYEKNNLTLRAK